jgi:hypothetical protein
LGTTITTLDWNAIRMKLGPGRIEATRGGKEPGFGNENDMSRRT